MAHTINAEQLTPKATIVVEGTLSYSRLVTRFEGDELAQQVAADRKAGRNYPTTEPYFTVSLLDPMVVPTQSAPSLEDQYMAERFFTHKSGKNAGRTGFNFDSKSPFPPARFQFLGHSQVAPIEDERELAPGVRVRLLFKVFYSDSYNKPGVGLDAVLVKDRAQFVDPQATNAAAETLRAMGFTIVGAQTDEPVAPVSAPVPPLAIAPAIAQADPWGNVGSTTPAANVTPATVGASGWD
jgi:hypothetical protein